MNKVVIPAILAVTLLVAGFVALMPVQKAYTHHSAVLAAIASLAGGTGDLDALLDDIQGTGGFDLTNVRAWVGGGLTEDFGTVTATASTTAVIIVDSTTQIRGTICAIITDVGTTTDDLVIEVALDPAPVANFATIVEEGEEDCSEFTGFGLRLAGSTPADADTADFAVFSQLIEIP
ncbi:MAG: hypothetical protein ACE5KA_09035 [Nitrososphaerales archaeon]